MKVETIYNESFTVKGSRCTEQELTEKCHQGKVLFKMWRTMELDCMLVGVTARAGEDRDAEKPWLYAGVKSFKR